MHDMKVVIAGGSGYLGGCVAAFYDSLGADIVIFSRKPRAVAGNKRTAVWDGKTSGPWARELEGADLLINLTGRSVDCRYTNKNKKEILQSRVDSVNVLGEVIQKLQVPPRCWIQTSSATIYRHAEDRPQDEFNGDLDDGFSADVCRAWENSFSSLTLPSTRKVILRTGIVLGNNGGALPVMAQLARWGFGGAMGSGHQYISWIHEDDFVGIVEWLRQTQSATDIYNCTAPWPLANERFTEKLSALVGPALRLALPEWLLRVGAVVIGTETELILKSRWVKPTRLLNEGYKFQYPFAGDALEQLFQKKYDAVTN
jgi:uncharacterized protein (TIGR01777 family)